MSWSFIDRFSMKVESHRHAVLAMSEGQWINLSLAFSHLELDSLLIDPSNR